MGFEQGLSGLNAASTNLDTIGNNIANSNTVGFKQSQTQFADMYASALGGTASNQAGIGVRVAAVAQQFSQGNITTTNNSLDMAISGSGFFQMSKNGAVSYSRNGQFQLDKNGYIVDNQGNNLMGYQSNAAGVVVPTTPGPIQISSANILPNATTTLGAGVNLNSASAVPTVSPFDPNNPSTYNNSTSATIYDSLGGSHIASLYYAQTGTNAWNAYLTIDGAMVPPAGTPLTSMTFNSNGTLATPVGSVTSASFTPTSTPITLAGSSTTNASTSVTVTSTTGLSVGATVTGPGIPAGDTIASITPPNTFTLAAAATATGAGVTLTAANPSGAAAQSISFNFAASTQFGTPFGVNSLTQNGFTSGQMTGFSTSSDGMVTGRYSNGQTKTLGQVVLANFSNPQGLENLGNNQWAQTSASGNALVGTPGSASLGVLQTSATEDSNVDLTTQLVNMITAQRTYQANAQTIKTQDQILQTIVSLQ
jgi:flagellar hook protein FlgE